LPKIHDGCTVQEEETNAKESAVLACVIQKIEGQMAKFIGPSPAAFCIDWILIKLLTLLWFILIGMCSILETTVSPFDINFISLLILIIGLYEVVLMYVLLAKKIFKNK
jgi:hypothetical protein